MPPHYLLQAVPDPASPLMRLLAAPGGPLLELPINHLNRHTRAMYAAVYHRRPVLNGYNGYWPADFPRRMALACRLPDPAALAELRRETGLATILVHLRSWPYLDFFEQPPPYGCAPPNAPRPSPKAARRFAVETYGAWLRAMRGESPDLRLVARDDTNLLFEVVGPAPP